MKCKACDQSKVPAKGQPFPGFCDACGWALVLHDRGQETGHLQKVHPDALQLMAEIHAIHWWYNDPAKVAVEVTAEVQRRS